MRARRAAALLAAALLPTKQAASAGAPSCRDDVFGGLSADCNLSADGSVASCCRRLALVELNACFCDAVITSAVKAAVGPDGLLFFASFARTSCGFNVTNGPACPSLTLLVAPGPPPVPQVVAPPRAPQAFAPPPPLYVAPPPPAATGARALADVVCDAALAFLQGFMCDALTATGLLQLLATAGPFTLFMPTNVAWYTTLVQLGLTKEELFEDPSLTEIVANHVVQGLYPSGALFYGQQLETMHRSAPNVARELRSAAASGVVRSLLCVTARTLH